MLRISAFGPNFVFRTNFVFATEFRLQRAPNRISSSHEFRLQGRFSSSNFVFAHNLSFSSWRTISSSKASEFRLQGGDETGTQFPGSMLRTMISAWGPGALLAGIRPRNAPWDKGGLLTKPFPGGGPTGGFREGLGHWVPQKVIFRVKKKIMVSRMFLSLRSGG